MLWFSEPEDVQNLTAIGISETCVRLFWLADGLAKKYTVLWQCRSEVGIFTQLTTVSTFISFVLRYSSLYLAVSRSQNHWPF